jgi:vibriolysin
MRKVHFLAYLCLLVSFVATAADRNYLYHQTAKGESGDINSFMGLSSADNLQVQNVNKSPKGNTVTRYRQTYMGVPIYGENIIISTNARGEVVAMHGASITGLEREITSVTPSYSAATALANMKARALREQPRGANRIYENEKTELVIYTGTKQARLAYHVSFFSDGNGDNGGTPSRPYFVVDAETGEVLFEYEGLTTADGTGPGGNLKTGQYNYGPTGLYPAFNVSESGSTCTMSNSNVKTVDLNHGTSGSTAYSYGCYENTHKQINGAYCPLNDAHAFGNVVFDMYSDWYGTAPLTFQLTMRVHYSSNYENAFWNGSSMTFGDGQNTFYPLVSLDVSAHEVSHGFTEQNSNLAYSGQSGGINEAFSDMAGEAAEFYQRGSNDFLVGEEIFKSTGALRYMQNPPDDGISIGSANDYTSGMNVHYSSGVFNKAFYTLATTAGWDTRKAFDVFVKANQLYWSSGTSFSEGRDGCMTAASDLGYNTTDVDNAFIAVDVFGTPPPTQLFDNDTDVISSLSTGNWKNYYITIPAGATNFVVTTSGSNGDADLYVRAGAAPTTSTFDCRSWTSTSNETCTNASPSAGDHYIGVYAYSSFTNLTVSVSYDGGGGGNNPPSASFTVGTTNLTADFTDTSTDSDGTITDWDWTFGDGGTSTSQDPSHTYSSDGTYTVTLTVTDDDGATDSTSQSVTVSSGGGGWVEIDNNNFEGGWGIWNDGGSDCRRSANDSAYAHQGTYCVRLRDNSGSVSSMTTDSIDLSGYSQVEINFWYYPWSFEGSEDFFVEINEGSGWVVIGQFVNNVDFTNNNVENPTVSANISGNANTLFRIRCDASGNGDRVYIDEVVISAQ